MLIFVYLYIVLTALVCGVEIYIYRSAILYKGKIYIFIYLMMHGKAFAIIIKVVKRKFQK